MASRWFWSMTTWLHDSISIWSILIWSTSFIGVFWTNSLIYLVAYFRQSSSRLNEKCLIKKKIEYLPSECITTGSLILYHLLGRSSRVNGNKWFISFYCGTRFFSIPSHNCQYVLLDHHQVKICLCELQV